MAENKTYSEKLKSPKWQKKRLEVLNRDNFTCQHCGDTETELHVHHLKYSGEPHDSPLSDLLTLCKDCHFIETFEIFDTQVIEHIRISKFILIRTDNGKVFLYHITKDKDPEYLVGFSPSCPVLKALYNLNNKPY